MMLRNVALAGCGLLAVAGAVVHGAATHRWSALAPNPARAEAAHAHVITLADYQAKDVESELPVKERSRVTCRQYTSASRLPPAVVSITSGPPGAVSTHTPDVCYPGSGYKTVADPKLETIDLPGGGTARYYVAEYEKATATSVERQRIRWAWTADGTWDVPKGVRFAYLSKPELFKLYVVTPAAADDAKRTDGDSPEVRAFVAAAFAQYAGRLAAR